MTLAVGLVFGAGVLLVFSPMLWPANAVPRSPSGGLGAVLAANLAQAGLARVPVATVAVDGSINAALLVVQMLAISDADLEQKLVADRKKRADVT